MTKLLMLQGLPASGKSTFARELAIREPGWTISNKDQIRKDLTTSQGWMWSRENERYVIAIRDTQITAALSSGRNVISDDTNFAKKHQARLQALARQFGAEFEVKRFDTPVEKCIEWDAGRPEGEQVGEKVIRDMAERYLGVPNLPMFAPVIQDPNLPKAILCDLDGTLALYGNKRSPYDATSCDEDDVNPVVLRLIGYYRYMEYQIIYMSGREDQFREPTERFLLKHHCPPGPVYMRKTNDYHKDSIIKYELFNQYVKDKYSVEFVIDDRPSVLRMWQSLGLFTLAVGDLHEF